MSFKPKTSPSTLLLQGKEETIQAGALALLDIYLVILEKEMQMSKSTFQRKDRIITLCFKMLSKTPCLARKPTYYPDNQFWQELEIVLHKRFDFSVKTPSVTLNSAFEEQLY